MGESYNKIYHCSEFLMEFLLSWWASCPAGGLRTINCDGQASHAPICLVAFYLFDALIYIYTTARHDRTSTGHTCTHTQTAAGEARNYRKTADKTGTEKASSYE